jgi:phospholipid/cholesterol/gamma-HCH transport system substrate-binding protein
MEDKLNPTLVGAFVLLLGTGLVAAVLWLAAGVGGSKPMVAYQSIVNESVAGLNLDAPVKYLGVDVGKVRGIAIDPANSSQVRLDLLVERGTPVRRDSEAVLKSQGLTGIAYVELSGGSAAAPLLAPGPDGAPPLIRSKPSLSARLENVVGTALASLDRTTANLNALFDADNRAALKRTLVDVSALMHTLSEQRGQFAGITTDLATTARHAAQASAKLGPTLDAAAPALAQIGPALERVGPALAKVEAAAAAIDRMAQDAGRASQRAGAAADAATSAVQQLGSDTLPDLQTLLTELRPLAGSLRQLSDDLRNQPSSLLLGGAVRAPGPGEGGAVRAPGPGEAGAGSPR